MGLPRVRFTVRQMMIAVVVAAAATLSVVKPIWDRVYWSRRAEYHRGQANIWLNRAMSVGEDDLDAYEKLLTRFKWHQSCYAKYVRALAYPGRPPPVEAPAPN